MAIITSDEPDHVDWPYWWSPEYDLTIPVTCVCDGSGWLEQPDEMLVACHVCNVEVQVH